MHGLLIAPQEPSALHWRVGKPLKPATQVPVATVLESVLPGQTALLYVTAKQRLPFRSLQE